MGGGILKERVMYQERVGDLYGKGKWRGVRIWGGGGGGEDRRMRERERGG